MIEPAGFVLVTVTVATATIGALAASAVAFHSHDFAKRVTWTEDATTVGKVRVMLRHSYHEIDWAGFGRNIGKAWLACVGLYALLVLSLTGFVEVFL